MPIFQTRTRLQILRGMVARVFARSGLLGLTKNSVVYHILAAAANEDAEQYFQIARLRDLFSIDTATGSDLDERAAEIQPGTITRRTQLVASTYVQYGRPGTSGTTSIPLGSIVGAQDSEGVLNFKTTSAGSILNGNSVSGLIPVTAVDGGERYNVGSGMITRMVTRVPGVTTVTNPLAVTNGRDRESDDVFRARLKDYIQSLARSTVRALQTAVKEATLESGDRILYAKVYEPATPDGTAIVYVDDGTGAIESYDSTFISADDAVLTNATGGETTVYTSNRPIRDDGSFVLKINTVTKTRGVDYFLNPATGQVDFAVALSALDDVVCNYRYYTELIQEAQRIVDGDPNDPENYPGVRPIGALVRVLPAQVLYQSVEASIVVDDAYDVSIVEQDVRTAIQEYINTLDIGAAVIAAEIIERAMAVPGMKNFVFTDLTGSSPVADQVVLPNQAARITSANISLV